MFRRVTSTDCQSINAIGWNLNAVQAETGVSHTVIAYGNHRESGNPGQAIVQHGRPNVDFIIFDWKFGAYAQVDEIIFLCLQNLFYAIKNFIKLERILRGIFVQNSVVVNLRIGAW